MTARLYANGEILISPGQFFRWRIPAMVGHLYANGENCDPVRRRLAPA